MPRAAPAYLCCFFFLEATGTWAGVLDLAPPRWKGLILAPTVLRRMENDLHLALRLRGGSETASEYQSGVQSDDRGESQNDDQRDAQTNFWTCTDDRWTCECGWGTRRGGTFEDLLSHVSDKHGVPVRLGRNDGPHFVYCNDDECERTYSWYEACKNYPFKEHDEAHGINFACEASLVQHLSAKHDIECKNLTKVKAKAARRREVVERKLRRVEETLARKAREEVMARKEKDKKEAAEQGIAHFLAVENIGAFA